MKTIHDTPGFLLEGQVLDHPITRSPAAPSSFTRHSHRRCALGSNASCSSPCRLSPASASSI